MKNFKLLCLLFCSHQVFGQAFTEVGTTYARSFGYKYDVGASVGVRKTSKKFEVQTSVSFGLSPKYGLNDGYYYGGDLIIYRFFSKKRFFLGTGVSGNRLTTSQWSKTHLNTSAIFGLNFKDLRLYFSVSPPPIKLDEDSWVYSWGFSEHLDLKLSKKWQVNTSLALQNYRKINAPGPLGLETIPWTTGISGSLSIRYYF